MIVMSAVVVFLLSMLAAPQRGLIAEAVRRGRLKRRIALQNLLRAVYELGERRGDAGGAWTIADLESGGRHASESLRSATRWAMQMGYVNSARRAAEAEAEQASGPNLYDPASSRPSTLSTQDARGSQHTYTLTPSGTAAAAEMTRTHRLWELFLIHHADIAPDHVHRDADELEHCLPPAILAELESRMTGEGRLTTGEPRAVPASPHTQSVIGGAL
ncbi:MAG: hypothetical protein H7210_09680 [Pyrinomonadaceae bacterium]|nr:hypothetical protein [Phycisphaerales bacterium]